MKRKTGRSTTENPSRYREVKCMRPGSIAGNNATLTRARRSTRACRFSCALSSRRTKVASAQSGNFRFLREEERTRDQESRVGHASSLEGINAFYYRRIIGRAAERANIFLRQKTAVTVKFDTRCMEGRQMRRMAS